MLHTVVSVALLCSSSCANTALFVSFATLQLPENYDCLWDDGVAPELALDFDCPNISSREALLTTVGVFSGFALLYQIVKRTHPENPALSHASDCVIPDYSRHVEQRK